MRTDRSQLVLKPAMYPSMSSGGGNGPCGGCSMILGDRCACSRCRYSESDGSVHRLVLQDGQRADQVGAGANTSSIGRSSASPLRRARTWSQPPSAPLRAIRALSASLKFTRPPVDENMRSPIDGPLSCLKALGSSTP